MVADPNLPLGRLLASIADNIGGGGIAASNSFMPVAEAYSAGDVIEGVKEFAFTDRAGAAVPSGSLIRILTSIIKIDASALIASEAIYTGRLYNVTPPTVRANNAAWTLASADLTAYRGKLTLGTPVDDGGALYVKTSILSEEQDVKLTGTSLFMELTNSGGVTFAAVARQVFLYGVVL